MSRRRCFAVFRSQSRLGRAGSAWAMRHLPSYAPGVRVDGPKEGSDDARIQAGSTLLADRGSPVRPLSQPYGRRLVPSTIPDPLEPVGFTAMSQGITLAAIRREPVLPRLRQPIRPTRHKEAPMVELPITIACGNYDRTAAIRDGRAKVDGCAVTYLPLYPEEIFHRAFKFQEFDVSEISFSSYLRTVAAGTSAYIGIPAFVSRIFRHSGIYIRTDAGIREPAD